MGKDTDPRVVLVRIVKRGDQRHGSGICARNHLGRMSYEKLWGRNHVRHAIKANKPNGVPFRWLAFGVNGEFLGGESRLSMKDDWTPVVLESPDEYVRNAIKMRGRHD